MKKDTFHHESDFWNNSNRAEVLSLMNSGLDKALSVDKMTEPAGHAFEYYRSQNNHVNYGCGGYGDRKLSTR